MSQNNTPSYAKAAGAYDTHAQAHTTNQRELEARILLKSNKMLQDLLNNWDSVTPETLEETLKYNRQIWMLFYDTAIQNAEGDRPDDLRSNIINLANFIFKREVDILSAPEKDKFNILLTINREIAAGLMAQNAATQAQQRQAAPQAPTSSSSSSTDIMG